MPIFSAPSLPLTSYDAVEMSPCHEDADSIERISEDDPRPPSFWSVYLHLKEGGAECVADFPTAGDAQNFADFLEALVRGIK